MIENLFPVALLVLCVVLILIAIAIKCLCKEIDEIKEKLEFQRNWLQYLDSCEHDHETRIDQLDDILELKEWLDKEKGGK